MLYAWAIVKTISYGESRKPEYRVTAKSGQEGFFPSTVGFQLALFVMDLVSVFWAWHARPLDPWLITVTIWLLYGAGLLVSFIGSAAATANPLLRRCWCGVLWGMWAAGCAVLASELIDYWNLWRVVRSIW